ncbi:MAG: DUF5110 domain-containing protein, partial [Armatimonadetes bacterium]|nr:DUF5110 domain-containing protein [Armatimonadota bacterium]
YIKNPPWKQWQGDENNADVLAEGHEAVQDAVRALFELRMRLIPYLYASFARYWREGIPPFRALVMDYPDDPEVRKIDDQYLMGEFLLVAPVVAGQDARKVYLPEGEWVDFWTGETTQGRQWIEREVPLEVIPLWVKGGALLPLAEPTLHAGDPAARNLTVRVYGDGRLVSTLFEDDAQTYDYERGEFNLLRLTWDNATGEGKAEREGNTAVPAYVVQRWERVG